MLPKFRSLLPLVPWACAAAALTLGALQYTSAGAVVFYGNDTFAHLRTIAELREGTSSVSLASPHLLQLIALKASQLLGTDVVATYSVAAILSLPLAVLSLGILARTAFGASVGALASFIFTFASIQPVQTYQDGTIPNIYAAGVLLPAALTCLHLCLNASSIRRQVVAGFFSLVFLVLIAYTHHLSTLVAACATLGFATVFSIKIFLGARTRKYAAIPLLATFGAISFVLAVLKPEAMLSILTTGVAFGGDFPWIHLAQNAPRAVPWNAVLYGKDVGGMVYQFGILGIFLATFQAFKTLRLKEAAVPLFIVALATFYWIGSLVSFSVEPARLARDFSMPGSILAAVALVTIWKYRPLPKPAKVAVLGIALISSLVSARHRLDMMTTHLAPLYDRNDEAIARFVSGLGQSVGIMSQNYYWLAVSEARGETFETTFTNDRTKVFSEQPTTRCIVKMTYNVEIAGSLPNPVHAEPLYLASDYSSKQFAESPQRRVELFCRE